MDVVDDLGLVQKSRMRTLLIIHVQGLLKYVLVFQLKKSALLITGFFMEPTVFTDVEDHMFIAKEESFGPVMVISKFTDG